MRNFTVVDTLGTIKACFALLPFTIAPGYVVGWALDLFEFRKRRPILKLGLSLPLSIGICPMLSYVLGRFVLPLLWAFYVVTSIACVLLLAKDVRRWKLLPLPKDTASRCVWFALSLVALWVVTALGYTVDLQIGDKLYPPINAFDHSVRTAMTVAIAQHIPPNNPFFANADAPLRYHYLWLLFCSLPMKLLHLSPRHVVDSGVVWCGLGLMCTIALGLKFLLRVQTGIERKSLLAIGLLCVTGLDIVPVLYLAFRTKIWLSDMEWWNDAQITSWAASVLWVPHNVAALIACFVGFLILRHRVDAHGRWGTASVIVAGMSFASAAGMSVYVTLTFAVAVGLWLLALVARKNWLETAMFATAGAVAVVWGLSFLSSLRGPAGGAAFVEFAVRTFEPGLDLLRQAGIKLDTQLAVNVGNAIFLPFNYAIELGFFLAVGVVRLLHLLRGKIEAGANELAAWTLVASSFLIGTFLRSSTINTNDLGFRCFLPAQLVLLLWGATMVYDCRFQGSNAAQQTKPGRWANSALRILLFLGIVGTAYQVFMLRMFPILSDHRAIKGPSWVVSDGHFGERTYALRSAYEALDAQLPSAAVLQSNPRTLNLILHMLYSGRETAAGDGQCGVDFGGDAGVCDQRLRNLAVFFNRPDGSTLDATCRAYGIDALVVEDWDPVWRDRSSWVWKQQPAVANNYVRAFRCGDQRQ